MNFGTQRWRDGRTTKGGLPIITLFPVLESPVVGGVVRQLFDEAGAKGLLRGATARMLAMSVSLSVIFPSYEVREQGMRVCLYLCVCVCVCVCVGNDG